MRLSRTLSELMPGPLELVKIGDTIGSRKVLESLGNRGIPEGEDRQFLDRLDDSPIQSPAPQFPVLSSSVLASSRPVLASCLLSCRPLSSRPVSCPVVLCPVSCPVVLCPVSCPVVLCPRVLSPVLAPCPVSCLLSSRPVVLACEIPHVRFLHRSVISVLRYGCGGVGLNSM